MSQENDKKITIKNPINYSFCRNYNHIDTVADTVILVKNIENFYKKVLTYFLILIECFQLHDEV